MSLTPSFSLALDRNYEVVNRYKSTTFTVYANSLLGFASTVSLSCSVISGSGWAGTISFNKTSLTPSDYATMTVNTGSTTPGNFTLRVSGVSSSTTKTVDLTLVVLPATQYTLGMTFRDSNGNAVNSFIVDESSSYSFVIKVFPVDIDTYPNNVNLSYTLERSDSGVTVSFNPSTLSSGFTKNSPATSNATITITTLSYVNNIIYITATDASNSSIYTTNVIYIEKRYPASLDLDNPPGPPSPPTELTATGKPGSILLAWNANSEADFDHYEIWKGTSSGGETFFCNNSSNSYVDINVSQGNTYYYKVKAVDRVGNKSDFSNEASASPLPTDVDIVPGPPSTPQNVTATGVELGIIVSWSPNPEADLDHYEVWRGTSSGGETFYANTGNTRFVDYAVSLGVTYYYKVRAVDFAGNKSGFSSEVSASPIPLKTLDLNIEIKPWVSNLKIWEDSSTRGKFYWAAQDGSSDATITFADGTTRTITKNLTGTTFANGVWYFYWTDADTLLHYSQTYSDAVGVGKGLVAIADVNTSLGPSTILMFDSYKPTIGSGVIQANSIIGNMIQAGTITADKLRVKGIFLDSFTWYNNNPSAGYIAWSSGNIVYNGTTYPISSGYTNKVYVIWNAGDTSFTTSNDAPAGGEGVFLIAINDNGTYHLAENMTRIEGNMIRTGSIKADQIAAGAITSDKITSDQIYGKDIRTAQNVGEVGGPAGIRMTPSELAGYSGGTTKTWYVQSSDGKLYAGGGNVILDNSGITVKGTNWLIFKNSSGGIEGYINVPSGSLTIHGVTQVTLETETGNINFYPAGVVYSHDFVPAIHDTYSLGFYSQRWKTLYVSGTVYSPNATFNGGTVTITPSGTSHPWIFTYYGTDPCLRSDANNYGVLGSDSYYLWKIYVNTVNASKLYGTVGLPQPLKRPLKGLEDLKMVQFREDGLPVEKSLPTHIVSEVDRVREEIRSRKIAEKANSKENASLNLSEVEEKEIEDEVNKVINSDTVNICHTVGWLIQCIKQLSDKVEELENKIRVLEGNKP
jgi:hypothetical protein